MHLDEDPQDQEDINVLLRHLDRPLPPLSVESVLARAGRKPRWSRWAAGIVLVAGLGGVAYALPGSPVAGWVDRIVDAIAGNRNPPVLPDSLSRTPTREAAQAGIAVDPGTELRILFTRAANSAVARVTLTGGSEVTVRAPGGAATFTWEVNRLVIDNSGEAAVYEIAIPTTAPLVEILVGGRRVFVKRGEDLVGGVVRPGGGYEVILR